MNRYNDQVFYTKVIIKNFAIFTEKQLRWSLFLNKNAGLQSWNFIKKRLQHRFFPVNIMKILRTPALENICERLFERFPTWASNITSNMGIDEDIFSETKQKINIQHLARWKKLTFSWCSWSFRLSLYFHCMPQAAFALHNKKMIVVKHFKTA